MIIVLEKWSPRNETVLSKSGNYYYDTTSIFRRTEEHEINTPEDKEILFQTFYKRNNSLKYCNGSDWKFADADVKKEYFGEFWERYHTIENYYGNGVVD